jgi:signal transduction histidine kinase/ActR/RegA family two-component response regulator
MPHRALDVLVCAAPRDAELTCEFLRASGIAATPCHGAADAVRHAERLDLGAIVLADEQLRPHELASLAAVLDRQPSWSDLPIVLFTGKRPTPRDAGSLGGEHNVTLLERPVARSTLIASVRSALRARRRQLETRALLERLEEANLRLAESDQRKDDFLAVLGHELRNPLSAIRMAVTAMQLARTPEKTAHHTNVIDRQSRNLTRIVDDLLDLSRISRGKIQLAVEPLDLRELAQRCVQAIDGDARAHQHALSITQPAWPVVVSGDPVRLEQVLSNLVGNAIKYTPDGGRIEITIDADRDRARLRVKDNGDGIPPELLPVLFDPFVQADKSLARSKGGLGLGLAVVKTIIDLHAGDIAVASAGDGRGSEFTVTLPLSALAHERARPAATATTAQKLRLVVVEDIDDARELAAEFLRVQGHAVETARDGAGGLATISSWNPDAAIVDIGLPLIDGYEVARQLRARGSRATLIALTGYGQPEDRMRALEAGFDVHLVKPLDFDALARVLADVRPQPADCAPCPPTL